MAHEVDEAIYNDVGREKSFLGPGKLGFKIFSGWAETDQNPSRQPKKLRRY